MRLVKNPKRINRRNRGQKAVAIVASFAGAAGGVSASWAQCVGVTNDTLNIARVAPFSNGTALSSIVSAIGVVNTSSLAQSSAFTGASGGSEPAMQGGIWIREVGGRVDSKANSGATLGVDTVRFDGTPPQRQEFQANGRQDCAVRTRTEYLGTQLGFDLGKLNIAPGTNIVIGLTTGYTEVNVADRTPGEQTFRGNIQVPFGGIYAALTSGGFSIDGQIRYDAYSGLISDFIAPTNTNAGDNRNQVIYSQSLTANSLTFIGNTAYRFNLPSSQFFIEPSLGVVWSHASVDDLNLAGSGAFNLQGAGLPARVTFGGIDTALGRASVRIGTTIPTQEVIWQPFLVGSVFHEFAGNVHATASGEHARIRSTSATYPQGTTTNNITVDRVGTYGHIGGGLAGLLVNSGWSGYIRADYREGDNLRGYNFNIGGRYQFAANAGQPASVKDAPVATEATKWSGLYLGVSGAGLFASDKFGQNTVVDSNGTQGGGSVSFDSSGALLGGQVGYNIQAGRMVYGLEAEWGWSNTRGGTGCPGRGQNSFSNPDRNLFLDCRADVHGLGMATGKIGWADNHALFYVKGGLAFGEVESYSVLRPFPLVQALSAQREAGESHWQIGWALGLGAEYAVSRNWSIKGEYMHFDLGSEKFTIDSNISASNKISGDIARVGINYRFGAN